MPLTLRMTEEVRAALAAARPVVALETSVVAQGLPPPANLDAAARCEQAVRSVGAIPATIAIVGGTVVVGASRADLERLADPSRRAAKAGVRDLGPLIAAGKDAGTTVSATLAIAERAGIRVFATGGIGGVHRRLDPQGAPDVSSDLPEIARRRVCTVCAGPKAILDLPATAEMLETLGVPVWGFGTGELPAFFTRESGIPLEHRFDDAARVAAALRAHWELAPSGALLCVPPPSPVPGEEIETALQSALREAAQRKLPGKEVTPFLLGRLAAATGGRSQAANLDLLENNARVAASIACAL